MNTTASSRQHHHLSRTISWIEKALVPITVLMGCAGGSEDRKALDQVLTGRAKSISQANLKTLAKGMLKYAEKTDGWLPASAYLDPSERAKRHNPHIPSDQLGIFVRKNKTKPLPLLSWRVAILPYMGQRALYQKFRLDEPWDSKHNKKLLAQMPKVFAPVCGTTEEPYSTFYQVFVGKGAPFNGTLAPHLRDSFPEGTAQTFLIIEAATAVPWTKPQ